MSDKQPVIERITTLAEAEKHTLEVGERARAEIIAICEIRERAEERRRQYVENALKWCRATQMDFLLLAYLDEYEKEEGDSQRK